MSHPWMTKGFSGPADNYLPPRKPLQLPLDPMVLQKMDGFDFGAADVIEHQLTEILRSDDYQRAVMSAEKRSHMATPEVERKRGVFDFYKRRNSTTSRETLSGLSSEAVQLGVDPLNAFHPLISIYFLAKEKLEREQRETNPGGLSIPSVSTDRPVQMPELRAPKAAVTNTSAYEMAGETPTGGRNRPRARTQGEDDVADEMANLSVGNRHAPASPAIVLPPQEQTPVKKEGMASGLLRRFSTRKHRDTDKPVSEYATPRRNFSVRKPRDRDGSIAGLKSGGTSTEAADLLSPPMPASEPQPRRIGLGRSTSVSATEHKRRTSRRGASEGGSYSRPPAPRYNNRRGNADDRPGDAASDVEGSVSRLGGTSSRTKSVGHARKESYQARRAIRSHHDTENVPEETDQDLQDLQDDLSGGKEGGEGGSPGGIKPVYLKGLFSVSTTSSKPLAVIREDIIRTLKQLNVDYREIKGGFSCRHAPSIDLQKNTNDAERRTSASFHHKRKLSFGGFMGGNSDKDQVPATPTQRPRRERHMENSYTASDEDSDDSENVSGRVDRRKSVTQGRAPGETSTHVQNDLGSSMALRFEIFVVKVPILNIHGIQFKKVEGGTWQYKTMAQTILNELRL